MAVEQIDPITRTRAEQSVANLLDSIVHEKEEPQVPFYQRYLSWVTWGAVGVVVAVMFHLVYNTGNFMQYFQR